MLVRQAGPTVIGKRQEYSMGILVPLYVYWLPVARLKATRQDPCERSPNTEHWFPYSKHVLRGGEQLS